MSYVLVIEADVLTADAAEEFLTCLGHTVRIVRDPGAAMRQILWCRPDVVLADLCRVVHADGLLQSVCDGLSIPLLDLGGTICLIGRRGQRCEGGLPEARYVAGCERSTARVYPLDYGVGRRRVPGALTGLLGLLTRLTSRIYSSV